MTTSRGMVPPFRMREVTIRATSKAAKTSISLCFTRGTLFPLSGFPRQLHNEQAEHPALHGRPGLKPTSSVRWASRTGSQRQRRFDWKPPNLPPPAEKGDVISRYSDASHLLGSTTSLLPIADATNELGTSPGRLSVIPNRLLAVPDQYTEDARHELPAYEAIHELPATETIQELPATEVRKPPDIWMADEDWTDNSARGSESIYMSLTCGDILHVLEMPTDSGEGGVWRVARPSDGRQGWVPSHCLRRIEDVPPRRQHFDASPVDGVFW